MSAISEDYTGCEPESKGIYMLQAGLRQSRESAMLLRQRTIALERGASPFAVAQRTTTGDLTASKRTLT